MLTVSSWVKQDGCR